MNDGITRTPRYFVFSDETKAREFSNVYGGLWKKEDPLVVSTSNISLITLLRTVATEVSKALLYPDDDV
ncbi:MAG: hypothetical protein IKP28_02790 [Clostridia bacterium]|nr:hypothetical protein [Clostridia bacterium]